MSYTYAMTTVGAKPKDYRLLVGIRYLNAGDLLLKGMKTLHKDNPFHFLVSLRSFIEYTRRGIWFIVWASNGTPPRRNEASTANRLTHFARRGRLFHNRQSARNRLCASLTSCSFDVAVQAAFAFASSPESSS